MRFRNTMSQYGVVSQFFHWLVFFLVFFMIGLGYFLDDIPKTYQFLAYTTHKLTGLSILALMLLRVVWTLMNQRPELAADTPLWQRAASRWVHFLLYATVILMPLAGWVGSVAANKAPQLGNVTLTLPIAPDKNLVSAAFQMHGFFAVAILVLVTIHVLAALYHHYVKRDTILRRMLPDIGRRQ